MTEAEQKKALFLHIESLSGDALAEAYQKLVPKPSYTLTVHVPAQDYPLAQLLFPKLGWSYERQKPITTWLDLLDQRPDEPWTDEETKALMENDL